MSKDKNPRRVADNEAMAKTRMLRTSPQKLNLVAAMIRLKIFLNGFSVKTSRGNLNSPASDRVLSSTKAAMSLPITTSLMRPMKLP